eukprot:CAMPEP_0172643620 /NCGR_PEP_ID=MMETSP1068-20121228/237707_1 /TAXON_ID=35684 /ORGANISM="Pseudopedinella elastica, Strain CCMP716" /LENGTH=126 /DNA_ID=CAMNT_0013457715 /DNA_START=118 /DNA_END=494 /DNA_ORIENTATION=-
MVSILRSLVPRPPNWVRAEPGRALLLITGLFGCAVSMGEEVVPVAVIYLSAYACGRAVQELGAHPFFWGGSSSLSCDAIPPLLGHLLGGLAARNLLPPELARPPKVLSGVLRAGALGLIMVRAGLG